MADDAKPTLSFLLGAGISLHTGMPSTAEITRAVIECRNVHKHTSGSYYTESQPERMFDYPHPHVEAARRLISLVKIKCDNFYYTESRQPNYEDIAYVLSQIANTESGEFENPALTPLQDDLNRDLQPTYSMMKDDCARAPLDLGGIASAALQIIRHLVWEQLARSERIQPKLSAIGGACQDGRYRHVLLHTLNHDLILEACLRSDGISYVDGFADEPTGEIRPWDPRTLDRPDDHVRLCKLHGSIDWYQFDNGIFGQTSTQDVDHALDASGSRLFPWRRVPEFLVGTHNKILDYSTPVFFELAWRFHRGLSLSTSLIVSGYSFGDKGVNTRVAGFMDREEVRMIVIDPNPETLANNARGMIRNRWERWTSERKLVALAGEIENTTWSEIQRHLV